MEINVKQIFNKYSLHLTRFTYTWKAGVAGTCWYHSHTGLQRAEGLFGMYIIRRPPEEEPHSKLYDFDLTEHAIVVQEWFHRVK